MCQTHRPHFAQFACKITLTALATVLFPLALTGCGRNEESGSAAPGKTEASKSAAPTPVSELKVALITPGPVSDNGWNAGAYTALQEVKKETGAEIQNVEASKAPEQEENISAFASKKFNIVFCHGAEMEDIALKLEKNFPSTMFVISSGRKVGTNTSPIIYHLEEGAYLLGMLAAGMTKTGKIASIGAQPFVPVKSVFSAFEAGAKAVKADIQIVPSVYTGSWDDVSKAKQQTVALLDQGADVIIQNVDAAAKGVFDAVAEKAKSSGKPVYALGTNSDQNSVQPDYILASAPIYSAKAFVAIAKAVKDGTFKPSDKPFGMKDGIIDFILNPKLESQIPADLKAKVEEARKKILDGSLVVSKGN